MATAGTVSRDQWIEAMEPTLLEIFTAGLKKYDVWKPIWIEKKSDKRREELLEYRKPDVVVETPEGAPYVQLTVEKVRTAAVVHADYTGMIRITHQMMRDKQYDDMMDQSWGLGESIGRKLYEDAVAQFYNGFGSVQSPDLNPWFYGTHPLANSTQTGNNLLAAQALSPDSFNSAQVLLNLLLNENGKITPMGEGKVQLIAPPALRRLALQLAMKGEYEPGSDDHDINVFEIDPVILPMLGQLAVTDATHAPTQWYLRDPVMARNYFFLREGPVFDTFEDPFTDDIIVKCRIAYSFLVASWRGVVGCQGA